MTIQIKPLLATLAFAGLAACAPRAALPPTAAPAPVAPVAALLVLLPKVYWW